LWTGVQIPPAPPDASLKAANNIQLAAFFLCKSITFFTGSVNECH